MKLVNVPPMPRYLWCSDDLEAAMAGSGEAGRRVPMVSDEELLRTIGDDLRSFYADITRQPPPPKIAAILDRIDRLDRRSSNLSRSAAGSAETLLRF
jgi:hypothetical protein